MEFNEGDVVADSDLTCAVNRFAADGKQIKIESDGTCGGTRVWIKHGEELINLEDVSSVSFILDANSRFLPVLVITLWDDGETAICIDATVVNPDDDRELKASENLK